MKQSVRYIVFVRPRGSLCWTQGGRPLSTRKGAETLARFSRSQQAANGEPFRAHIVKVVLPWTKTDQRILDEWRKTGIQGVKAHKGAKQ